MDLSKPNSLQTQDYPFWLNPDTLWLSKMMFISVPSSTIFSDFLIFSILYISFGYFLYFFPKNIDIAWESPMTSIIGPYQYKNRGKNLILAGQAAWEAHQSPPSVFVVSGVQRNPVYIPFFDISRR